jgi:hypothetical protein
MDKFYEGHPEHSGNGKVKNAMTECTDGECDFVGWVSMSRGQTEISQCKIGGCLTDGWTTLP